MKTEFIFLIHLVTLTLTAVVSAVNQKATETAVGTKPVESAASSAVESIEASKDNDFLKTSDTFHRRHYYPRTYHYRRNQYPQYYRQPVAKPVAATGYNNRYPQTYNLNRYSYNRPSSPVYYTRPSYYSQYSYYDSGSSSDGTDSGGSYNDGGYSDGGNSGGDFGGGDGGGGDAGGGGDGGGGGGGD